ncbi:MAG: sensor histidine kinase, partial [Saprospiraceae bacterium]
FTNYLATNLAVEEKKNVELWIMAYERLNNEDDEGSQDYTLHNQILISNFTIPIILVNDAGIIENTRNHPEVEDENGLIIEEKLKTLIPEMESLKNEGREFKLETEHFIQYVYYGQSKNLTLLQYFPFVQFLLIAGFIAFGYFSFSSSRRAEQNQVWVGMAKETAHQLGTPISAIMGWIDHLKDMYGSDEYMQDVVTELQKDTGRLELIADRFSKIGSEPKMEPINIYDELESMRAYMQRRAARRIEFDFPDPSTEAKMVDINPPLFNWVLENLLRNALDAMDGKGKISAKVYEEKNYVCIDVSDTGKGIPASKFKTVFKPGYSTKKRGWGLGLSLAKRIIETYHSGRIFVSKSIVNEQTTFTIKLPVNHHVRGAIEN